jgi:CubicO group peptidase (beta-lactamase class C family)
MSCAAFLKMRSFDPLGMVDTGVTLPADKKAREATGYSKPRGATFAALTEDPTYKDPDHTYVYGSGDIYSTVRDLAKWDRALVNGDVLGGKTELLFKPNLSGYGYACRRRIGSSSTSPTSTSTSSSRSKRSSSRSLPSDDCCKKTQSYL